MPKFDDPTEKLHHYTIIFQAFVFMQIFNQINSRKLEKDEYNVFENFCNNPFFFLVLVLTVVIQTLMVIFGGKAIQTIPLSF